MKIILYEMKKIWNWKVIGLMLIIVTLFYSLFLYGPILNFRASHPMIERHDFAVEMTEQYGPTMTGEEIETFLSEKKTAYESELNAYFEFLPIFEAADIASYDEYQRLLYEKEYEELTKEEIEVLLKYDTQTNFIDYKIQTLDAISEERLYVAGPNNIMSGYTVENTMQYLGSLAILVILLSAVLTAPLVANDQMKNIHFLQYTAKNGRKIIDQQFKAVLISGLLLTTISILFFGRLILRNDILAFWNNGMDSFLILGKKPLFDLTLGNYLLWSILFIYLLNISVTFFVFIISRFSQNMMTLIMKVVPIFAGLTALCTVIFQRMFRPYSQIYQHVSIKGIEGIVLGMLCVLATILSIYILKREKNIDVV